MDRNEERRRKWRRIIDQCASRESGVSISRWIAEHGVSEKQYYYWKKKFREEEEQAAAASQDLPAEPVDVIEPEQSAEVPAAQHQEEDGRPDPKAGEARKHARAEGVPVPAAQQKDAGGLLGARPQGLQAPRPDPGPTFAEFPAPPGLFGNAEDTGPDAVIRVGQATIELSNTVSDRLLDRILGVLSHAC